MLRRVVNGILDQILDSGLHGIRISHNHQLCFARLIIAFASRNRHGFAVDIKTNINIAGIGLHLIVIDGREGYSKRGNALDINHATFGRLRLLQIDEATHQFGQTRGFLGNTTGEIAHGVRIVGGIGHSLGKQRDRAGRSFQLVGHVGNKVAPNRLEPTLFGHVIDKDGIQVIANIANAHAQIQHVGWHRLPRFKPPAV